MRPVSAVGAGGARRPAPPPGVHHRRPIQRPERQLVDAVDAFDLAHSQPPAGDGCARQPLLDDRGVRHDLEPVCLPVHTNPGRGHGLDRRLGAVLPLQREAAHVELVARGLPVARRRRRGRTSSLRAPRLHLLLAAPRAARSAWTCPPRTEILRPPPPNATSTSSTCTEADAHPAPPRQSPSGGPASWLATLVLDRHRGPVAGASDRHLMTNQRPKRRDGERPSASPDRLRENLQPLRSHRHR